MKREKTEFVIGELYWHKFPYDHDENYSYYDIMGHKWFKTGDSDTPSKEMLLFICNFADYKFDQSDITIQEILKQDGPEWGIFICQDRKILVYLEDLCMVKLSKHFEENL